MADTTALKNRIRAAIKSNDNQEITGPVLQQALLDMVDELNGATETEAQTRQNANATLQQNINNEAQQRQNGDSTLQQGINTERQARIDADAALGQRITTEINQEHQRAEDAFDKLDMMDAAGSLVAPNAIDLTLLKNDGSEEDPDWRTLCHLLIPSVSTERAGLMSVAMRNLLYNLRNAGYAFGGIAVTATNPGTPTANCFYIVRGAGTYTHFKNSDNESIILENDGLYVFSYESVENNYWEYNSIILIDNTLISNSDNLVTNRLITSVINSIYNSIYDIERRAFKNISVKLFQGIEGGKTFDTSGYRDYLKNATCKLVLNGTYSIPAMPSGYMYNIYKYVSDNEGVAVYTGWREAAYTVELSGTYVFVFRHVIGSAIYNWNNDDTSVINNIIVSTSDKSTLEGRIDSLEGSYDTMSETIDDLDNMVSGDSDSISVNIASGNRLSRYYTNVTPGKSYGFRYTTDNLVDLPYIKIFAEIDGDLTEISQINADEFGYIKIPAGTNRILFFNATYVSSATSVGIYILSESISLDVERLKKEVFPYENNVVFCEDISSEVLVEMYFPNMTNDWKIVGISVYNTLFRLNLKDAQGNTHIYGEGSNTYSLEGKYSDLIHTWIDESTCEVIGYFILHYTGTDYSVSDNNGFDINVDKVTDINCSPRIKEYLARTENLVLIGDSMFGKGEYNILSALLRSATDKKVFNGGMGGMRMSIRGNTYDDALSYVGISDAIYNEDWTDVQAAAIATGGATNPYQKRLAELKAVDWSLPTTVICCYCNNDITGNVVIGDMWVYTAQKSDFVKTTLLGAMNYGIYNILSKYPLVRLVHTNLAWRYKNDKNNNVVPPYAYLNTNDDSDSDYNEAMKENASRLGVSVFDFSAFGGRNEFNRNTENGILFDRSHYNVLGYEKCAEMIKAIDEGWLM